MENNLSRGQRLLQSSGCLMSSSCLPIHKEYSRVPILEYNGSSTSPKTKNKRQSLVRKLARKWKNVYGTRKRLTFQYDADSYARNFDEGVPSEEPTSRFQDGSLVVNGCVHEPTRRS